MKIKRISNFKGKHHTHEAREKMRSAHLGKKHSDITKEKMSLASRGKSKSKEHCKNIGLASKIRIRTPEWRNRQSKTHINRPNRIFKNTSIEIKMKELLDALGIGYIFQHPLESVAIVDFYVPSKKLVIFCDGCYWHGCPEHYPNMGKEKDSVQTNQLKSLGYVVARFWEHEINKMQALTI